MTRALRLDRLELLEADPVDLLGVEVERRPAPDRGAVELLAVRRRPEARVLAGRRQVVAAERVEEREVGRVDDVADDVADALAVRLRGDLDHRRHDGRLDRDLEHPLDLGDRPLGDDARRGEPRRQAVAQDLRVGGHERRVGVESGDERLEPLGGVGRLELGQLRQELLRAAHLVDDAELVEGLVVLLDLELGDDLEHVAGDPVLGRQAVGRDRGRLGRGPLHQRPSAGPSLGTGVLEAVGVAVVAVERRGRRVELEDRLPEAVGEVVDRRRCGFGKGHAVGLLCSAPGSWRSNWGAAVDAVA